LIGIKKHLGNGTLERLRGIRDDFHPTDLASVFVGWVIANYSLQYLAPIFLGTVAVTLISNLILHWRKSAYHPYRLGFWLTNGMALWFISVALDIFKIVPNYAGATILSFYVAFYLILILALGDRKRPKSEA
jgi:hypothetical protein